MEGGTGERRASQSSPDARGYDGGEPFPGRRWEGQYSPSVRRSGQGEKNRDVETVRARARERERERVTGSERRGEGEDGEKEEGERSLRGRKNDDDGGEGGVARRA